MVSSEISFENGEEGHMFRDQSRKRKLDYHQDGVPRFHLPDAWLSLLGDWYRSSQVVRYIGQLDQIEFVHL